MDHCDLIELDTKPRRFGDIFMTQERFNAQLVLALFCLATVCQPLSGAEKPNFVLILCDDMGFSDLGCTGSEIATPNIDRLAGEGQLWTQFYNNAKCTTTRATLITGLYPRRPEPHLRAEMATLPESLSAGGYVSHMAGKWHLGSKQPHQPTDRGFDTFYGLLDGCCNFFDPAQPDPPYKGNRVRWFGKNESGVTERITQFPSDFYTTDAFTDSAIEFVNSAKETGKPFFLNLNYTAPHYPLHAPEIDIAKYRGKYDAGWDAIKKTRFARQIELGLFPSIGGPAPANRDTPDWNSLSKEDQAYQSELMAVYAAMIDRMDQQIGRLLHVLDDTGLSDNTFVIFLSDNGGCAEKPGGFDRSRTPGVKEYYTACGPGWATAQNTPFRRYKQWVHEGGISTPLIIRSPPGFFPGSHRAGRRVATVGHIVDLPPTILALAGVSHLEERGGKKTLPLEGVSLVSVISGESKTAADRQIFFDWNRSRAVRDGDWKLVKDRAGSSWELYNIATDRTEQVNLAAEHPETVTQLENAWNRWAKKTGVKTNRRKQ